MTITPPRYMEGTKGTMAVDWERRVDMDRMRRERTAKATQAIADAGYDAVVILSDPNMRYVTSVATSSVSGSGGFHYSLLTAGGAITHWDSADHAMVEKHDCPWLDDIRYGARGIGIVPAAIGGGPGAEMLRAAMANEIVTALKDRGVSWAGSASMSPSQGWRRRSSRPAIRSTPRAVRRSLAPARSRPRTRSSACACRRLCAKPASRR